MPNQTQYHRRRQRQAPRYGWVIPVGIAIAAGFAAFFLGTAFGRSKLPKSAVQVLTDLKLPPPTPAAQPSAASQSDADTPVDDPTVADLPNPNAPLSVRAVVSHRVPMVLIQGGVPGTRRSAIRAGVDQIVAENGAKAGLNGTFFANASLNGTDNLLIGPSICGNESAFVFSPFDKRPALAGRPMVLFSPTRTRIYPYKPDDMDDEPGLRALLPNVTDAFLGGVWLVHNGQAISRDDEAAYQIKDAEDPRRRAFFFLTADGQPGLGATTYVERSSDIAKALSSLGIQEAVLLDSGFSTSLVCGNQILVTGHTSPGIPSRPVPHAILLFAQDAPVVPPDVIAPQLAQVEEPRHHSFRLRRHRA